MLGNAARNTFGRIRQGSLGRWVGGGGRGAGWHVQVSELNREERRWPRTAVHRLYCIIGFRMYQFPMDVMLLNSSLESRLGKQAVSFKGAAEPLNRCSGDLSGYRGDGSPTLTKTCTDTTRFYK